MPCKPGWRWVILCRNPYGAMQQPFIGAPRPFWCSTQTCHPSPGAGVWCASRSILGIVKSTVFDLTLWPWSLCSCRGTPKWQKKLVTSASATVKASWLGMVQASGHLVKQSIAIRRYVSLVTPWEGPYYINGYTFEWGPNIALLPLAPIPSSGAASGCTGVTLPEPLLNIVSCLEPVVHLPDLIQGLVDTQVTSEQSTM
jgi:hypothetical protein